MNPESFDIYNPDPLSPYSITGDATVKKLMLLLGVPDIFKEAETITRPFRIFMPFDNHPTHWITINLWKNMPEYSPNHGIHRMVKDASANGLLFEALPKAEMTREEFEKYTEDERDYRNSRIRFSQFPIF